MRTERLLASSLSIAVATTVHAQVTVYVDDDAPDGGNGLSWNSAMNDLHRAIDIAHKLGEFRGEIRIAGGVYTPDQGTGDRSMAFVVPSDQTIASPFRLVGGFAGHSDLVNPDARDTSVYRSILDADLLGNDTADPVSRLDNSENIFIVEHDSGSGFSSLSGVSLDGLEFNGASVGAIRGTVSGVNLSFRGCSFTNNRGNTGPVMKLSGSAVTLDGCTVAHNKANGTSSGALDFDGGDLNITNCVFENNDNRSLLSQSGMARGGAISMNLGRLSIADSSFQSNRADGYGGAVYIKDSQTEIIRSTFFLNSTTISNNSNNTGNGGAVYAEGDNIILNQCEFSSNLSQWGGAAFSLGEMTVSDSLFHDNIATVGGAVVGLAHISACEFLSNNATLGGGSALLIAGSSVDSCAFREGEASFGGAIDIGASALSSGPITIRDTVFENNVARYRGGAIRDPESNDVDTYILGCEFLDNTAGTHGGAVSSVISVENSEFVGNMAESGWGGGTFAVPIIHDSSFFGNYAWLGGGGAHNPVFVEACSFVGNSARDGGGGVVLVDSVDVTIQDSVFADNRSEHAVNAAEIHKDGDSALTIIRSSFASTQDDGRPMLFLAGGQTWIESSTIWNESWEGSPLVVIGEGSPIALVHTNLRMEPGALVASDQNDIFFFGGNMSGNPRFVDAAAGDLRLRPGSPLIDAGFVFGAFDAPESDVYGGLRDPFDDLGMVDIGQGADGYLDIGAAEFRGESCFADVNGDGALTSTDFTAWLAAFGDGDAVADQNRDRVLTPSDFTAWIANFNNGCP